MLYCENCNAPVPEESAACPYCGALNPSGGEKKYMERLYALKEDVEELSHVPGQEYRGEMRKIGRIIGRTVLIFAAAAVVFCGAFFLYLKQGDDRLTEEEAREQLLWEKDNFPLLDAMYTEGDYDGIVEFVYGKAEGEYHSISNWEHTDFLDMYMRYQTCLESVAEAALGEDADDAVECIIDALFLIQERNYLICSDGEWEQIEEYRREIRSLLCTEVGMREGDIDLLYEESWLEDEYGAYFDYNTARKNVQEYVKSRLKQKER